MKTKISSLQFRLKILLRRECLVWLVRRGIEGVACGWFLNCKSGTVLFKDRTRRGAQIVSIDEIKACGVV